MREIKFRAWDKEKKEMFICYDIYLRGRGNDGNPVGNNELKWENIFSPATQESTILMQFTGLLDKNGKEIYEGDILNVNSNGVVEWNNELVGFITSDRNPNKPFYNILWASLVREGLVEIIGNIYENPELLTPNTQ